MKRISRCLLIGLLSSLNFGVVRMLADLEVSASVQIRATTDFHAPLAAQGTWIEVGSYGRCWRPARVAVEWRPYGYGHWIWTDCGWYWVSDEPWAWACYHYGSWVYESDYGWIWVPGIEWAPAWVTWRIGGGYCGWAPLAPRGIVVVPRSFVFVEVGRFHDPVRPATLIVNNTTIIRNTTELTSLRRETRNLGAARKINESRKQQDRKESSKDQNSDGNEKSPPAVNRTPQDKDKEPPKTDVGPPPQRPTPDSPSEKPSRSGRGKGGGKGKGKD